MYLLAPRTLAPNINIVGRSEDLSLEKPKRGTDVQLLICEILPQTLVPGQITHRTVTLSRQESPSITQNIRLALLAPH